MRRRLYMSGGVLGIFIVLGLLATATILKPARANAPKADPKVQTTVKIVPFGPSQADIDAATVEVTRNSDVQKYLAGTSSRLLSFEVLDSDVKGQELVPPTRFRAIFYDYTNNRVITAEGDFRNQSALQVSESFYQPVASEEEFDAAVRAVTNDKQLGPSVRSNTSKPYRPMPPVISEEGSNGHGARIITVGLLSGAPGSLQNEIVGVNMSTGSVVRFENHAPPSALASPEACGIPNAGQTTTSNGTAGQYQFTVMQGPTELWSMLIIRPSASSGASSKRSGIEVRNVNYLGKSVLSRGHVPILNVKYVNGECGPYRDWQYQEGMFNAPVGTDPAPGIRLAGGVSTTALESGIDTGNFRGVAVYRQDPDWVLVTELEAGWYRYVMEWRFSDDGTIRPRFGFGATDNSCVCFAHNHHVYWRLDFDVANVNNNVFVSERGKKFLVPMQVEGKLLRNFGTNRRLVIQNGSGNEGYIVQPNLSDGTADSFGVSDMWVLRYQSSGGNPIQLEDGITCVTCSTAFIQIDPFINGESVVNQDIVVWYGAHFLHADSANREPGRADILGTFHVVGPEIYPMKW